MSNLITREPQNLLAWNEELNRNPPWPATRMSVPSINNPAPNGTNTSSIFHENNQAATTHLMIWNQDVAPYVSYCLSSYFSPINRNWLLLFFNSVEVYFDIQNGVIGTIVGAPENYGIEPAGTDWYRCWMSIRIGATSPVSTRIYIAEADNDTVFDGLDQDSFYVWRPQINEGAIPDDSIVTREVAVSGIHAT